MNKLKTQHKYPNIKIYNDFYPLRIKIVYVLNENIKSSFLIEYFQKIFKRKYDLIAFELQV